MIYAAKVMACYGVKLIEQPEILRKAKEEFDRQMEGRTYKCPIPDEIGEFRNKGGRGWWIL